jgi:hypothetical protein
MKRYIGGFFQLEIPNGHGGLHGGAVGLRTGRACIAAILNEIQPTKVFLPYFICDVVVRTVEAAGAIPEFYAIGDDLQPASLPDLGQREMLLAVNYFGLMTDSVMRLANAFGPRCIVDNTQAFFAEPRLDAWTIYSARKFFGVPDGAYVYGPSKLCLDSSAHPLIPDIRHLINRLEGRQQLAYRQCRAYEERLDARVKPMSKLSESLLASYDYEEVAKRRRANFAALHHALAGRNTLRLIPFSGVPYAYPLLLTRPVDRADLARRMLYVPTLWRDVITRGDVSDRFDFERSLAANLLPLPIDQRYEPEDMEDLLKRLEPSLSD